MKEYVGGLLFWLVLSVVIVFFTVVPAAIVMVRLRGTCQDLLVNLLADLIVVWVSIVGAQILYLGPRRRLRKFFSLDSRNITIYISNIRYDPKKAPATGVDGQPATLGEETETVAFRELTAARDFHELFTRLFPSLPALQSVLSKLRISDVQVDILPSPKEQEDFDPTPPFISIGGPAFNAASGFIQKDLKSRIQCHVINGKRTEVKIRDMPHISPITEPCYGFIERTQGHVFYAVGSSSIGSAGAAYHLATQWKRLYKKYGDGPFLKVIKVDRNNFKLCLETVFETVVDHC